MTIAQELEDPESLASIGLQFGCPERPRDGFLDVARSSPITPLHLFSPPHPLSSQLPNFTWLSSSPESATSANSHRALKRDSCTCTRKTPLAFTATLYKPSQ